MSEAAYPVVIHVRARDELDRFAPELREELRERVFAAGETREPTSKPYAKALEYGGADIDLFAVRVEDVRAICTLAKPQLRVLLVDRRRVVYQEWRLETAIRRAQDGGGG